MTDEQLAKGKQLQDKIKARTERIKNLDGDLPQKPDATNAHYNLRRWLQPMMEHDLSYTELHILATMVRAIADRRLQADTKEYSAL